MTYASQKDDGPIWTPNAHCPALDGLRGLAILLVTLYRFGRELDPASHPAVALFRRLVPAGQYGVDLFFVLSGFLITGILLQTKDRPNYYRNFIVRRALRIFPLYFASLFVGLVVLPQLFVSEQFEQARSQQFYLWTYLTNVRMSWLNSWCFGPFDHFWSLAVEEHFYLVWPMVVLCCTRRQLLWTCNFLVVTVLFSRTLAATFPSLGVAVETLTVFRLDALSMGAVAAVLILDWEHHERLHRRSSLAMLLLLPLLLIFLMRGRKLLALPSTVCPAFLASGMLALLLSKKSNPLSKLFEGRGLRFLGKYSYGMYVIQLPLVTLLPLQTLARFLPVEPITHAVAYVVVMFSLTVLLAVISYHLLERPFLKMKSAFH